MAIYPPLPALAASIAVLRKFGVIPTVAGQLDPQAEEIVGSIETTVLSETPAFTTSGNPDVLPELREHLDSHVAEILWLLTGHQPRELSFVRDHAERRAAQKFPLDAVLASYRHLHKGLAEWIRDGALKVADDTAELRRVVAAVSEFTAEYIGTVSTLLTSEYVSQTRTLAEIAGDRRSELLNLLLNGYDESDARAAQLLRRAGYLEQRQSFCVAVARSVEAREMENAARAERMADAVTAAIRNLPIRILVGIHEDLVTIVMSGTRRQSGWTAPQSLLADRVYPHLRMIGPAALIGVSTDAPSTSHVPHALSEARIALDFAHVADRVMPFGRIPFRDMLVRVAAMRIQTALPEWVEPFLAADRKARGSLTATLRAYADADMNVLKTAEALSLHPNTIYARMQKITDVTARNPLSYNALTELLLATDCAAYRP